MCKAAASSAIRSREAGFGFVSLILVGIALALAIGVWMSSSGSGALTDIGGKKASLNANTVIQQGNTVRSGIDQLKIAGWAVDQMFLDTSAAVVNTSVGIYHPTGGAVSQPNVPADALADSTVQTYWKIGQVAVPGIGTAADDWAVILGNLKYTTCASINAQLYNDAEDSKAGFDAAAVSSANEAGWTTADPTTNVLSATVPAAFTGTTEYKNAAPENAWTNRAEGCLRTSDGAYVYFNVVQAL